jgi:hypothetical protein
MVMDTRRVLDTKTYWLTDWLIVSRNMTLTLTLTIISEYLSSERAPDVDWTVTFILKVTSGHKPQPGLDTKTDRLTDTQLQCNFDFDFDLNKQGRR